MYHCNCTTRMDNSSGLPNGLLVYKVRWTQSAQQESQSEGISFEAPVFSTGVSGHTIVIYAKLMFMIICFEAQVFEQESALLNKFSKSYGPMYSLAADMLPLRKTNNCKWNHVKTFRGHYVLKRLLWNNFEATVRSKWLL